MSGGGPCSAAPDWSSYGRYRARGGGVPQTRGLDIQTVFHTGPLHILPVASHSPKRMIARYLTIWASRHRWGLSLGSEREPSRRFNGREPGGRVRTAARPGRWVPPLTLVGTGPWFLVGGRRIDAPEPSGPGFPGVPDRRGTDIALYRRGPDRWVFSSRRREGEALNEHDVETRASCLSPSPPDEKHAVVVVG